MFSPENERLARVEENVKSMREDVKEMKQDVKSLLSWKWRLLGAAGLIAFLVAYFTPPAHAGYYPWGWQGWLPSVPTISDAPTSGVLLGSAIEAQDTLSIYVWNGSAWVVNPPAGTVTSFSFTNANGFVGNVTNPTSTPNLTLSTSVNGVVKGNGTALSSAASSDIIGLFAGCSGTEYLGADGACHSSGGTPGGANTDVQYNSSGSFGGSSNLVWINSPGNLGIGTASPGAELDVEGSNQVFLNSGNVGIGTTNTSALLHIVNGSFFADNYAGSTGIVARRADGTTSAPTAVQSGESIGTYGARGYGATSFASSNAARINLMAGENWSDTAHGTTMNLDVTPNGTTTIHTAMTIIGSGNVGIGTISPSQLFSVADGAEFGAGDQGSSPTASTLRGADGVGSNISGPSLTIRPGNGTGTGGSGSIQWQVAPPAASGSTPNTLATQMSLTNAGNLGIGTASPGAKLEVNGGAQVDALTASTPLYSNSSKQLTSGTFSGNTTEFATASGSLVSGDLASWDGNGNAIDSGIAKTAVGVAGSNTDVQYNSSGVFAGNGNFTTDGTGDITLTGKVNATTALLSNLTASESVFTDASKNLISGTVTGNTTKVVTGSGSYTSGDLLKADANGNAVDAGVQPLPSPSPSTIYWVNGSGTVIPVPFPSPSPSGEFLQANGTGWQLASASVPSAVTFTVDNSTTSASSSQNFIYTNVTNDSNSGYNATTGKYTIPSGMGGVWHFSVTIYTGATGGVGGVVYDNASSECQGAGDTTSATGTTSCEFPVSAGDVIAVFPSATATATAGSALNKFSGFLVH